LKTKEAVFHYSHFSVFIFALANSMRHFGCFTEVGVFLRSRSFLCNGE